MINRDYTLDKKKVIAAIILVLMAISTACTNLGGITAKNPVDTPLGISASATVPPVILPTHTPTATLTPTPIPAARLDEADRARFNGDWDQAILSYQTVLTGSDQPELQSVALLGLGRTHYLAGDFPLAIQTLHSFIEQHPDSPYRSYAHFHLAQAYSAEGNYFDASEQYLQYLTQRSGVVDAYILNLRGDALRSGGDHAGAIIDYRAALQAPSFLGGLEIEIKTATSHAAVGDFETAIGMYQDIYSRTNNDYTKSLMDLYSGQAYLAMGKTQEAHEVYQDSVNNYPTSSASYQALLTLVESEVPVNELNRGIVDYYAGQYGVALAAFDRYFQSGAGDPATARYYNGLTLRAIGNYQAAIDEWNKIIQNYPEDRFWDDAWEQKGYTQWWYLREHDLAIQTLLDFVVEAPNHPRAGEFLFDAAAVADRANQVERAAQLWERVAVEYPGYEKAMRAIFLSGINRYRIADYTNALAMFERHLANSTTLEERAAAYFWQGKTYQDQGDFEAAKAAWGLAASADPTGYYSERARDLLRQTPAFTPPEMYDLSFDTEHERIQAQEWIRTTFNIAPEEDLSNPGPIASDPRWVRGTELWELGLYEEARTEFEDLRKAVLADPVNSYYLANHLVDLGLYRSAIFAAREVLNSAGMSDAETMSAPPYFNHLRFGAYFSDLVIPIAQQYDLHPLFLLSLIRQESAFEGFVRSSAGARGLMQIMPATGQEIVSELGWPLDYDDSDLHRPIINVTLGADYLDKWRNHFKGDLFAALAAYNGGPGNAIEWQSLSGDDQDLFVEVIRFEETRNYIRSIYEIFNLYRRIYDRTP